MRTELAHAGLGVLVFTAVVAVVLGGSVLAGGLAGLAVSVDDTEPYEYDTEALFIEKIEAEGEVEITPAEGIDPEPGLVVIDAAHENNFEERDIRELTSALTQYGHEVRIVEAPGEFSRSLEEADALVVIDPQVAYPPDDVNATQRFVAGGGRVLLMSQPDRNVLVEIFVESQRSRINSLATVFGISFGTDYLYNLEVNDGNHRNVLAHGTDHELVSDVDTAVFYTATEVRAAGGEPLLVTDASTHRSTGSSGEFTVAAVSGNVLAVGDADFISGETYNVADNEAFIEAIVEFLSGRTG